LSKAEPEHFAAGTRAVEIAGAGHQRNAKLQRRCCWLRRKQCPGCICILITVARACAQPSEASSMS